MHKAEVSKSHFLITGGAGFIGSNLSEYLLSAGARVTVLDNISTGFQHNIDHLKTYDKFIFIQGDITDYDVCLNACKGVDYVSHQAALGSVPRSINNPVATNKNNIDGFLNVLNAARESVVKRFIYASSSSVYGDSLAMPKQEDVIGKPLSPYAVTKLTNELYASVFSRVYNMEVIGLRYFNIFGPRQNPQGEYAAAIPLFIDALLNEKEIFINGDGEQTRDFTFVDNAVMANVNSFFANSSACNNVYNIALGERTSLNQLISILEKITGKVAKRVYRDARPGDIRDSLAQISKAKASISYNPQVKIEEGLRRTVGWFTK